MTASDEIIHEAAKKLRYHVDTSNWASYDADSVNSFGEEIIRIHTAALRQKIVPLKCEKLPGMSSIEYAQRSIGYDEAKQEFLRLLTEPQPKEAQK